MNLEITKETVKKKRRSPIFKVQISDETINEVVARFKQGETISSLSKEYGISIDRIYKFSLESYRKESKPEIEIVNQEDVMLANC